MLKTTVGEFKNALKNIAEIFEDDTVLEINSCDNSFIAIKEPVMVQSFFSAIADKDCKIMVNAKEITEKMKMFRSRSHTMELDVENSNLIAIVKGQKETMCHCTIGEHKKSSVKMNKVAILQPLYIKSFMKAVRGDDDVINDACNFTINLGNELSFAAVDYIKERAMYLSLPCEPQAERSITCDSGKIEFVYKLIKNAVDDIVLEVNDRFISLLTKSMKIFLPVKDTSAMKTVTPNAVLKLNQDIINKAKNTIKNDSLEELENLSLIQSALFDKRSPLEISRRVMARLGNNLSVHSIVTDDAWITITNVFSVVYTHGNEKLMIVS